MRNGLFTSFDAWFKGICVCLLTMLALSANARAQTQITTGTIQGTVSDANGAVLPGANVEIKNLDTNRQVFNSGLQNGLCDGGRRERRTDRWSGAESAGVDEDFRG